MHCSAAAGFAAKQLLVKSQTIDGRSGVTWPKGRQWAFTHDDAAIRDDRTTF
jgi:hypothetical protein